MGSSVYGAEEGVDAGEHGVFAAVFDAGEDVFDGHAFDGFFAELSEIL